MSTFNSKKLSFRNLSLSLILLLVITAIALGGPGLIHTISPKLSAFMGFAPAVGETYLSDMSWSSMTNGWGPVEKDKSNGENLAGDGLTLTLNGVTYAKGLGTHANSDITYNLGGAYTTFISDVGIDDESGSAGSVVFQVYADGTKIYDSGLMRGTTATKSINVSVAGKQQLRLMVTNGGDGANDDHGDWAGARLVSSGTSTPTPTPVPPTPTPTPSVGTEIYLSDMQWAGVVNAWGPVEKDKSNGEELSGDGQAITLNGVTYPKGLGVHAYTEIIYNLGGNYSTFKSDIGIDDESGSAGSSVFQVYADGTKIYDSGLMRGTTATKSINVSVAGKQQLKLVVTDGGDGISDDHGDWAGARLVSSGTSTPTPTPVPPSGGEIYLSDMSWSSMTNGWGPVEKDKSNGEDLSGDGLTLTLNGVTYAKGLGTHANSDITYNLGGAYTTFISDVGVDDESGSGGSVVFQVYADGTKIYDSGLMRGTTATKSINVSVAGKQQLRLMVTNGGDGANDDHGDWAGARLVSSGTSTPTPTPVPPTPTPTPSAGGKKMKEYIYANGKLIAIEERNH
jgi:hypothetical protein